MTAIHAYSPNNERRFNYPLPDGRVFNTTAKAGATSRMAWALLLHSLTVPGTVSGPLSNLCARFYPRPLVKPEHWSPAFEQWATAQEGGAK